MSPLQAGIVDGPPWEPADSVEPGWLNIVSSELPNVAAGDRIMIASRPDGRLHLKSAAGQQLDEALPTTWIVQRRRVEPPQPRCPTWLLNIVSAITLPLGVLLLWRRRPTATPEVQILRVATPSGTCKGIYVAS